MAVAVVTATVVAAAVVAIVAVAVIAATVIAATIIAGTVVAAPVIAAPVIATPIVAAPIVAASVAVSVVAIAFPAVTTVVAVPATAAAASTPLFAESAVDELPQLFRNLLVVPLHYLEDVTALELVPRGEEAYGRALLACTTRSANPVDVILRMIWGVVVHHQRDAFDVQATSCHIGGTQNLCVPVTEVVQCLLAFLLVLVTVNRLAVHTCPVEAVLQLLAHLLRGTEDQRTIVAFTLLGDVKLQEDLDEFPNFSVWVNNFDKLCHVLVGLQDVWVANLHLVGLVQKLHCQLLDILGPRCREEERVPSLWNGLQNLPDLRLKTHIQHSVGFIDYQLFHTIELEDITTFDEVIQPPRGRDQVVAPTFQGPNLWALRSATVGAHGADASFVAKLV
mmetsp:Transcript_90187/g.250584  ORF Transcript_90187/g.250584 Transcript_90187/m.250584 type:complete len:393 (-) Transcript_90187:772-1950(-)